MSEKNTVFRKYRPSDRAAVRRLCCETGFIGNPIDPVFEDRELFADFLTAYYTDFEPESAFVACVAEAVDVARRYPDQVVLLGIRPERAEEGYGWIEPGESVREPARCRRVRGFWEKPQPEQAARFFRRGFLWNSLVVVARVEALKALGRIRVPAVDGRLARMAAFAGGAHEGWALEQAYAHMGPASFSREVLARSAASLLVMPVQGVHWSDWGTPDRVVRTLHRIGSTPPWLPAWEVRARATSLRPRAVAPARG